MPKSLILVKINDLKSCLSEIYSDSVIVPSIEGEICFLPYHKRVVTRIDLGVVCVNQVDFERRFLIQDGVVFMYENNLVIIGNFVQNVTNIRKDLIVNSLELNNSFVRKGLGEIRSILQDLQNNKSIY